MDSRTTGSDLVTQVLDALALERASIQAHLEEYHHIVIRLVEAELEKSVASVSRSDFAEKGNEVSVNESIGATEKWSCQEDAQDALGSDDDSDFGTAISVVSRNVGKVKAFVDSPWFEAFFVVIILLNTVSSALSAQYDGFDIGYSIGYPGTSNPTNTWPSAKQVFRILEVSFTALYTLEITLKLAAYRLHFWKNSWNLFDTAVIALWYALEVSPSSLVLNPTILRLSRLFRLMRLVRHIGWFEAFDSLHMLIVALRSCVFILIWSTLVLAVFLVMFALVMQYLLGEYFKAMASDPAVYGLTAEDKGRTQVYTYFGTFTRSFVSAFEMAFAGNFHICRTIMEHVGEEYALLFLAFKCVVALAVTKVINGVFLHETLKVCSSDDNLMVQQRRRAQRLHLHRMTKLFRKADEDGDARLSFQEFKHIMKDDWIRTWLSAMELDAANVKRLWKLLDDGDARLTASELLKGVDKLKGAAKSVDMNHLSAEVELLKTMLEAMQCTVGATQKHIATHSNTLLAIHAKINHCIKDNSLASNNSSGPAIENESKQSPACSSWRMWTKI